MRVKYKYLPEPFSFADKSVKVLVIENETILRNTILDLYCDNVNESFIFSKNYMPVDYAKSARFIGDILNVSLNDKKIINKMNAELEDLANTKYFLKLNEIKEDLLSFSMELSSEMNFDVDSNDNIETSALLKLCSFRPRDDASYPLEKLLRLMLLMKTYLGVSIFLISNLYLYYSVNDTDEFFKTLIYNNIMLIDIEATVPDSKSDLAELMIIDKDLCIVIDN